MLSSRPYNRLDFGFNRSYLKFRRQVNESTFEIRALVTRKVSCFVGFNTVYFGRYMSGFRMVILPLASAYFIFLPWRRLQQIFLYHSTRCTNVPYDCGLPVCDGFWVTKAKVRSGDQKFPAWHTKAAPNGKCCEGYTVPSMVRLMYQLESVLK